MSDWQPLVLNDEQSLPLKQNKTLTTLVKQGLTREEVSSPRTLAPFQDLVEVCHQLKAAADGRNKLGRAGLVKMPRDSKPLHL